VQRQKTTTGHVLRNVPTFPTPSRPGVAGKDVGLKPGYTPMAAGIRHWSVSDGIRWHWSVSDGNRRLHMTEL